MNPRRCFTSNLLVTTIILTALSLTQLPAQILTYSFPETPSHSPFQSNYRSPNIVVEAVTVTDNNNNIPEYGETVSISVTLRNSGESFADNITSTISSNNPYAMILVSQSNYGDINPNESATGFTPFSVQFSDSIPHLNRVNFSLSIFSGGGLSWERSFYIDVNAPVLSIMETLIYDPVPEGNGNGLIDPGESFIIYLPIKNIGGAASQIITLNVFSNHPQVNVVNVVNQLPPIASGDTYYPTATVTVGEQITTGTEIIFSYNFQTANYVYTGEFNKYVGGAIRAQVGTGTMETGSTTASPISIYYRSLRGQMVYTAAELAAAGAVAGIPIIQFGFFVTNAPLYPLPNFTIRMKHTTAANAAQHDAGPFTTVLVHPSYQPVAGGWHLINLTTPFVWNGVDNILVDTAFSSATQWNASGRLRINNINNGFRFIRSDAGSQIDAVTTTPSNDRPQATFVMGSDPSAGGSTPRNLSVELQGTVIQLDWDTPLLNENRNPDGYNVYRNGIRINTGAITENQYTDNSITGGALYYYHIKAIYGNNESSPSNIVNITVATVAIPVFNPAPGIYSQPITLSISCPTENSQIYYTLDGTVPTQESILYQQPFEISYHTEVRVRGYSDDLFPSAVIAGSYYILYAPANLTGQGGTSSALLNWEAPWTPENNHPRTRIEQRNQGNELRELLGYNIYRAVGTGQFMQINTTPIQNLSYNDVGLNQAVYRYFVKALYDIGESEASNTISVSVGNVVANPVFSPPAGIYAGQVGVSISCETGGASIYYTLNGQNPTISSPMFTGTPILITTNITIKAIAMRTNWLNSNIVTAVYTIETSSVEDDAIPIWNTELRNAYPNPFNPSTQILWTLKESSPVRISVYNISGALVDVLVNEVLPAGEHRINWDGTDMTGLRQSSGIYFYQMITPDYREVKKLIMLK